jgi:hypothetical protein
VPVALAVATTLFATGGVIGILYRLANPPGSTGNGITTGAWLGLACCVALAAGAWWSLRDESIPGAAAPPVTALPRPGA